MRVRRPFTLRAFRETQSSLPPSPRPTLRETPGAARARPAPRRPGPIPPAPTPPAPTPPAPRRPAPTPPAARVAARPSTAGDRSEVWGAPEDRRAPFVRLLPLERGVPGAALQEGAHRAAQVLGVEQRPGQVGHDFVGCPGTAALGGRHDRLGGGVGA